MNLLCNHCGIKAQTLQDAVIGKNKTQQHLLWITVKTRYLLFKLSQLNKKSQKYGQQDWKPVTQACLYACFMMHSSPTDFSVSLTGLL